MLRSPTIISILLIVFGLVAATQPTVFAGGSDQLQAQVPTTITAEVILFVAPQKVACRPGLGGFIKANPSPTAQQCIQISLREDGPFHPGHIHGFEYKPGFKYKLLVQATSQLFVLDLPTQYELISVLEITPVN